MNRDDTSSRGTSIDGAPRYRTLRRLAGSLAVMRRARSSRHRHGHAGPSASRHLWASARTLPGTRF